MYKLWIWKHRVPWFHNHEQLMSVAVDNSLGWGKIASPSIHTDVCVLYLFCIFGGIFGSLTAVTGKLVHGSWRGTWTVHVEYNHVWSIVFVFHQVDHFTGVPVTLFRAPPLVPLAPLSSRPGRSSAAWPGLGCPVSLHYRHQGKLHTHRGVCIQMNLNVCHQVSGRFHKAPTRANLYLISMQGWIPILELIPNSNARSALLTGMLESQPYHFVSSTWKMSVGLPKLIGVHDSSTMCTPPTTLLCLNSVAHTICRLVTGHTQHTTFRLSFEAKRPVGISSVGKLVWASLFATWGENHNIGTLHWTCTFVGKSKMSNVGNEF